MKWRFVSWTKTNNKEVHCSQTSLTGRHSVYGRGNVYRCHFIYEKYEPTKKPRENILFIIFIFRLSTSRVTSSRKRTKVKVTIGMRMRSTRLRLFSSSEKFGTKSPEDKRSQIEVRWQKYATSSSRLFYRKRYIFL